ncbi:hypothetical protein Pan44_12220 [Caulifigura coniformis]|uniref:Uncharacterized protein n=1 Tax=Caulifigura coniformis TaxID=2527983 RepID=A0A517SAU2_9PLAN|nr:hypothetical protein [Caulifigura coniformis]QDT53206.1 hypothetical protein Pan44_12220 [Caulifigura coniformis]
MKSSLQGCLAIALCVASCGCGGAQARAWRGPRLRAGYPGANSSIYTPPVEPPREPAPVFEQPQDQIAPPVRPGDLEPAPTPAIRLEAELPAPPSESEESVQFMLPVPPSRMPNALDPVDSRPLLEQSSAERPIRRDSGEMLGEGKIASAMRGHSTYTASHAGRSAVRLMRIESDTFEQAPMGMMQVEYVPLLAPVPPL